MNAYYTLTLLAFVILLAILLIRYVNNTVDREFRNLARAVNDPDFRRGEIERMNAALAGELPLAPEVAPLPKPASGFRGALPPVLLALGVILLWGGGAVPRDKQIWYYGGMLAIVLAAGIMFLTVRRRKFARTARHLLFRADLQRLDDNRGRAIADLRELLKLTPWDDSAWAELSDDLAAVGKLPEALAAMEEASRLDPRYDEYRMITASLAIRARQLDQAREALAKWTELDGVNSDDPRLAVYQAALRLAEGHREEATAFLRKALAAQEDEELDFLDADQALTDLRDLLPGRKGESGPAEDPAGGAGAKKPKTENGA